MPKERHIMEALGRARIVIEDSKVTDVGTPAIEECPLAKKFAQPVERLSPDQIKMNVEGRIRSYGMFTKDRKVISDDDFVVFGASELMSAGIAAGVINCAVIACDGAGTVLAPTPLLVQGIGGRMSGLVSTTPIAEVIARIERAGGHVLEKNTARLDQHGGVALAYRLGYTKVAVTVAMASDCASIRAAFPGALIFAVHLTGISKSDAKTFAENSDLISGCASRWVREVAGPRALLQGGSAIPVFAMTPLGKRLVAEKIVSTKQRLLIKGEKLPYCEGKGPKPLV